METQKAGLGEEERAEEAEEEACDLFFFFFWGEGPGVGFCWGGAGEEDLDLGAAGFGDEERPRCGPPADVLLLRGRVGESKGLEPADAFEGELVGNDQVDLIGGNSGLAVMSVDGRADHVQFRRLADEDCGRIGFESLRDSGKECEGLGL